MTEVIQKTYCKDCGRLIRKEKKRKPCPRCGSLARHFEAIVTEEIRIKDFVSWERKRTYIKKHRFIGAILFVLAIISPFVGYIFEGILGIIIGLVISLASYFVGPYIAQKATEIVKGESRG
jgi:ribosomal protein S27AE